MTKKLGWRSKKFIAEYFEGVMISTDDVHYGPLAPGEKELKLLGSRKSLKNKKVLEVGCGTAQNCIALAKWGADCTGVDISKHMIDKARTLASKEKVRIKLIHGNAIKLSKLLPKNRRDYFDIAISSYAIGFIYGVDSLFKKINPFLKMNGQFVFCLTHPRQKPDKIRSLSIPEHSLKGWEENYFTINQMIKLLDKTGFLVERVIEQTTKNPSEISECKKSKYPYKTLRLDSNFDKFCDEPHTIIYVCRKVLFSKKP